MTGCRADGRGRLGVRELARVERLDVGTPDCLASRAGKDLEALPWLTLGPFDGNRIELFDQGETAQTVSATPKPASDDIFARPLDAPTCSFVKSDAL